jgi:hypothetical protein
VLAASLISPPKIKAFTAVAHLGRCSPRDAARVPIKRLCQLRQGTVAFYQSRRNFLRKGDWVVPDVDHDYFGFSQVEIHAAVIGEKLQPSTVWIVEDIAQSVSAFEV